MKRLLAAFGLALFASSASANIFQPAYLELTEIEIENERCGVLWKVLALGTEQRLSAYVSFPARGLRTIEEEIACPP